MALTTPILQNVAAFDASIAQTFSFIVVGGDQVTANRLLIQNNATLATVYDGSVTSYQLSHVLPAGTLVNGTYYRAQIQTFNASGAASLLSAPITFYCYTAPTITILNMPTDNVIRNSNFQFNFEYAQTQGELLNSYVVTLLDASQAVVATSGMQYIGSSVAPPTDFSYYFAGFDDSTQYYINCTGYTINQTLVTTGNVEFSVLFVQPNVFSLLNLMNLPCDGQVQITSNLVIIDGESNPSPPIYIDDKEVDLRATNSWIKWTKGYTVSADFTFTAWARNINPNSMLVQLMNAGGDMITISQVVEGTQMYLELYALDGVAPGYYIQSNRIALPAATETIFIYARRVNCLCDLEITNIGVVV